MVGADKIAGVEFNPARKPLAEKFGMTDFVNLAEVEGDLVPGGPRGGRSVLLLRVHRQRVRYAPGTRVHA